MAAVRLSVLIVSATVTADPPSTGSTSSTQAAAADAPARSSISTQQHQHQHSSSTHSTPPIKVLRGALETGGPRDGPTFKDICIIEIPWCRCRSARLYAAMVGGRLAACVD